MAASSGVDGAGTPRPVAEPACEPLVGSVVGPGVGPVTWSRASASTMLRRAALLRCPRCGERKIVRRWFATPPPCPRCGLDFNPDGDAAVGWIIVNLGLTEIVFIAAALLALVLTWPDVPWTGLTIAAVAGNLVLPLLLHPSSRTIWAAIYLMLHRMDGPTPAAAGA